jgi:hypothetical protein
MKETKALSSQIGKKSNKLERSLIKRRITMKQTKTLVSQTRGGGG